MIDDRLLEYWRAKKLKRFRPSDEFGHGAYERWWLDHHGAGESYTYAHHVEAHLKRARRLEFLRRFDNLFAIHDYFQGRYGALIGAEGFRRALWTLAVTDQQQRLLHRHRAARAASGAEGSG
jgi:hypothetical protein